MSIQTLIYRNNSTDREESNGEKITITQLQSNKTNKSNIQNKNNSTMYNEHSTLNQGKVYPYPILYHKEKDPLEEFKLRIIKSKNKGEDQFLKNYLKFNFAKNDASTAFTKILPSQFSNNNKSKISMLENSKNNLFITANKKTETKMDNQKLRTSKDLNNNPVKKIKPISDFNNKHVMKKSHSDIFNPFSKEALSQYRTSYLHEMEKRGNNYNKIKIAQLQRIALQNFSSMSMNGNHYHNGSIPTGKTHESYILETKKRKRLPGIREYICSRLKNMKSEEVNTPEFYRERSKKYEKNKLPEIMDIKNSGRFQFHVFHDQYGFKKELDKKATPELKMTKEKVRDLKILVKINKINDPEIIDIYRRAIYSS